MWYQLKEKRVQNEHRSESHTQEHGWALLQGSHSGSQQGLPQGSCYEVTWVTTAKEGVKCSPNDSSSPHYLSHSYAASLVTSMDISDTERCRLA